MKKLFLTKMPPIAPLKWVWIHFPLLSVFWVSMNLFSFSVFKVHINSEFWMGMNFFFLFSMIAFNVKHSHKTATDWIPDLCSPNPVASLDDVHGCVHLHVGNKNQTQVQELHRFRHRTPTDVITWHHCPNPPLPYEEK